MTTTDITALTPHLEFVRSQFPALSGPWTFLDNAGGSQVLTGVADRVRDYLLQTSVQLGATYAVSQEAAARVADGTRAAAELINAADPREVVLGSSATQLIANFAQSYGATLTEGDEVIVTSTDHEANIGAWMRARGAVVRVWRPRPDTLELHLDDLGALMTGRTRLVCVTHASNILGRINPVARIAERVHAGGAQIFVDGVAYAPHRLVDVQALDVDFYMFSFYKVFGPHISLLYGKLDHLLALPNINHTFVGEQAIPYKLQPGNVNYELTYSLRAITDYLEQLGGRVQAGATGRGAMVAAYAAIADHEAMLAGLLLTFLRSKARVRVIGPATADPAVRVATISFVVEGRRSSEFPRALDDHHVAVRYGNFYARRLMDELALDPDEGVIRVSMAHYNTVQDVDRLIGHLDTIGLD
ncbi:cysteine desulfurase family protein (TIGR01976 family) [Deinococcus metalli]|uniref:Cysteine desulfurase family protein (TIGR01976 family) n=1 Tax=Deinococcus metalli TaxID=1141878 RepID=A0A7W8KH40_9DEIO|nr:cysteine desulfurase-like protein [Deinococcus metalli]MBB5378010.1 cysteine desulfurase family protein (TIGR01976 family) [Deinococcus metalli]GHF53761.1 cysteine desulfurase-like protein [Deinococcus metalli]